MFDLLDAPLVENGHAVGHRQRFGLIVGDEDEGDAELALQLLQLALHLLTQLQIEGAEGFVEQQHPRSIDQGAGQGHTLALTAGELHRFALAVAAEGDHVEGFFGAFAAFAFADAFDFQSVGHVVEHVHVREQRVVLKHSVYISLIRRQPGGFVAVNPDGTCARLFKTGDQAQTGGFAGTGRAQHGKELAVLDVDGNPVYGFHGCMLLLPLEAILKIFSKGGQGDLSATANAGVPMSCGSIQNHTEHAYTAMISSYPCPSRVVRSISAIHRTLT